MNEVCECYAFGVYGCEHGRPSATLITADVLRSRPRPTMFELTHGREHRYSSAMLPTMLRVNWATGETYEATSIFVSAARLLFVRAMVSA